MKQKVAGVIGCVVALVGGYEIGLLTQGHTLAAVAFVAGVLLVGAVVWVRWVR
ncbi:MAG: hypothetical protein GY832_32075 [Chloroflexi bacterium]|nr:hypothetical protein [Chloroflexota bacterium]